MTPPDLVSGSGLPKSARLLKAPEFKRVLRRGRRTTSRLLVLYVAGKAGATAAPRIGLTVSRKVGKAVTRNRVKRVIRDYFRTHRAEMLAGAEYVVIARPQAGRSDNETLRKQLHRLFQPLMRKSRDRRR